MLWMKPDESSVPDKRLKEEFLLSILHGDRASVTALDEQAKRLGITFDIPRLVCVMEIQQQKEKPRERDLTLRKVISLLDNRRQSHGRIPAGTCSAYMESRRADWSHPEFIAAG
ncbi:carbohydrate diacid transcriptional activator CdaR [Paenibacillus larvae subsp. larvae]|uniref:Carbohydrate diacid transcriptional activator CdaR n=2 Tax=Paenibacillus larvae TaxID=1464 RepID=A0A2L1TVD5_9BACL|nr:carbohydrate diacid transcriptional activator CdaR [Paenibacillus larvae subsp. larvae]AVG10821.1 carbohydrate diacid transcriptional activator CdaR [Paenibacillus larvae subsp. larvae DSM 25430]PCK69418.1 hypothetical protein PL1_0364 [Paenibacillus larvae subsp. larvae B-3650]AVF24641.1 carbohydrate diacid transcriptional activator CdaR [Paenibacillus larvae subsp. larvae]AVF29402.1 carbohydrate diacid transcriptional activator CdaR [Paenibacillus larvae subsp. larvae]